MTKEWQKRIDKMPPKIRDELLHIVQDIIAFRITIYDIKSLEWYIWLYRLRKGKIRIIFTKSWDKWIIQRIDFRWDVYKWI